MPMEVISWGMEINFEDVWFGNDEKSNDLEKDTVYIHNDVNNKQKQNGDQVAR